jgi:hypothetical protein
VKIYSEKIYSVKNNSETGYKNPAAWHQCLAENEE